MKAFFFIFLSSFFLVIFNSCQPKQSEHHDVIDVIDVSSRPNKSLELSDLFLRVNYIPLETNPNCIVGSVDQLIEANSRFYILDKKTNHIFVFNANGIFLRKIGRQGKGPGEFLFPKQIFITENDSNLYLYDSRNKKIMQYDIDGVFKQEIKVDGYFRSFTFNQKNNFYLAHVSSVIADQLLSNIKNQRTLKFVKINKSGKFVDYIYGKETSNLTLGFSFITSIQKDQSVSFVEPLEESVFTINGNLVKSKYKINFGDKTVPLAIKNKLENMDHPPRTEEGRRYLDNTIQNYFLGFVRFFESGKWVFLSYIHDKKFANILYSKNNKNAYSFYKVKFENSEYNMFYPPVWMNNEKVYSSIDPSELFSELNSAQIDKVKFLKSNLLLNVKENDNPIIISVCL